jgi:hypothetical protein
MIWEWRSYREEVEVTRAELAMAEEAMKMTRPKADLMPEETATR